MESPQIDHKGQHLVLRWGVKQSLHTYVLSLPDGGVEAAEGARIIGEPSVFQFRSSQPLAAGDKLPTRMNFVGTVKLSGYGNLLQVNIINPALTTDGAVPGLWVQTSPEDLHLRVANLNPAGGGAGSSWTFSAVLTDDGADWLGPQYFPGQKIDDALLSFE